MGGSAAKNLVPISAFLEILHFVQNDKKSCFAKFLSHEYYTLLIPVKFFYYGSNNGQI